MCVFAAAAPGLLGLGGAASNVFLGSLGLGAVNQVVGANRANQQAQFQARQAVQESAQADQAFALKQEGLTARLKEERKANAQEQLALAKRGLQQQGQLRASERAGLTIDRLLGDAEREEGEASNLLNQTLASTVQQYRRNTLGLVAERDNRRNVAQSKLNQAKSMRRGPLDVALGTLSSGLSSYSNLYQKA